MTLGAEPKKVAILAALVAAALGGLYMNSSGDSTPTPAPRANIPVVSPIVAPALPSTARVSASQSNGEFKPRVPGTRPDDRPDPASINPELRLDLLAKVQAVPPIEAGRNLFQFGAAPPPPGPIAPLPKDVPKIMTAQPAPAPRPAPLTDAAAAKPPAPPINLKYYGYKVSKLDGHTEAFLLDGEDIILASENETVKQRYRIVRIARTSIVIEDTQAKSTQTLQLQDIPS